MAHPVLFSAAVGAGLGATMTALTAIIHDCKQLTNGNECLDRGIVVLLVGIPVMVILGLVSLDIGVGGWQGPVIALAGGTVALAGQILAGVYGGQHTMWAAAPIGGVAFCCVAGAVVQTSPPLVRLACGLVPLAVCISAGMLMSR